MSEAAADLRRARRWYVAGVASYFVPGGVQAVLFPYMVTVVLGAGAAALGFAQMASQLPSLLLVLFAGVLADRVDPRRILLVIHLLAGIPALVLSGVVAAGGLSYPLLVGYALVGGTMTAFAMPARDALLNRVAGADLQRTVAMAMGAQFGVQIVGYLLAGTADSVGLVPVLVAQGLLMMLGAGAALALPGAAPSAVPRRHPLRELGDGLATVLRSPRMRPAWLLTAGMGLFFSGAFIVLMPMALRDFYGGTAADISAGFLMFMLGTLVSIGVLMRVGALRRQGRAVLCAVLLGSVILLPIALHPPQWLFYAVMMVWGMGGGVAMTVSRAVMQEAAPVAQRGRILATYSFANMGAMPLGSLMMGALVDQFGVARAVLVPAGGAFLCVVLTVLASDFWKMGPADAAPSGPPAPAVSR